MIMYESMVVDGKGMSSAISMPLSTLPAPASSISSSDGRERDRRSDTTAGTK